MSDESERFRLGRAQRALWRRALEAQGTEREDETDGATDVFIHEAGLDPANVASALSQSDRAMRTSATTQLQRERGNRYVQRVVGASHPGSGLAIQRSVAEEELAQEAEADRIALQVYVRSGQRHGEGAGPAGRRAKLQGRIPAYLTAVTAGHALQPALFRGALHGFRQQYNDATLERYREGLAEPGQRPSITQVSPLKQVRRMEWGGGRDREEVARDLPGNDEMVREVLEFFYPSLTPPAQMNDALRNLAARMYWQAVQASRTMDLVPRPSGGAPGFLWLVQQGVKMAWRRGRDEGIYVAVRNTVAARYRTEYELAREGIEF